MKHIVTRVSALVLCSVSWWPVAAVAQQFDGAKQAIRRQLVENQVPGIAVSVWRNGKIVWAEGFGWADVERRVPATEHTMFHLASVTKPLTSLGVMTLVQAGKVDLDQPANRYLGRDALTTWIGDPQAVTVRRLANHTSGLPGFTNTFYGDDDLPRRLSLSETIRRYGIVVAPAGERYQYSNIGYGVLSHLLAQVSGKSYADFMRQEVFLPLGMTHSSINIAPGLEGQHAIRYDFERKPIPFYTSVTQGSGSAYSSAHDLARLGMFLLKNRLADQQRVLNDASIEQMLHDPLAAITPTSDGSKRTYAVGWISSNDGGYDVVGHEGSTSGTQANFTLVPAENLGVAVLANTDGGAGGADLAAIRAAVLKSLLPKWSKPSAASSRPAPTPAFDASSPLIGEWRGQIHTYQGEQSITLSIRSPGDVRLRIGGEPRFPGRSTVLQETLLTNVALKDGFLTGDSLAQLETSDTQRRPHVTSLDVKLRGDVLSGQVMAQSVFDGFWHYGLPYWTQLRRVGGLVAN
ncbi:serine hydrolase domain-containing protein [Steroidobacter sp.]|uniref:serine hydrolase domain-containing protein n=1 Tax=Steroidobacter sp. TaxID=1978227 RepID=UPI0025E45918|nr:serine hydrolase domain-containing protein [Steroidobacter sp.]